MQNNIKKLLEQWQMAQHCNDEEEWKRIEKELLVKYNIDITINSICDFYLEKYNLVLGGTK